MVFGSPTRMAGRKVLSVLTDVVSRGPGPARRRGGPVSVDLQEGVPTSQLWRTAERGNWRRGRSIYMTYRPWKGSYMYTLQ